jgi:hypothetical protein
LGFSPLPAMVQSDGSQFKQRRRASSDVKRGNLIPNLIFTCPHFSRRRENKSSHPQSGHDFRVHLEASGIWGDFPEFNVV